MTLERRAVRVGLLDEVADEVVAGLLAPRLHVRAEIVGHLLEAAHQRGVVGDAVLEHGLDPAAEQVAVALRECPACGR